MKLVLKNFRCHREKSFELQRGGTILVSGSSGVGKTSIFEALLFALYGNVKKPCSFGARSCSVRLEDDGDDDFVIMRTHSPSSLKVYMGSQAFEQEQAQELINGRFGDELTFFSACYVRQDERHKLLDGTKAMKQEIIEHVAMSDSRIAATKNMLSSALSKAKGDVMERQRQYDIANARLEEYISIHEITPAKIKRCEGQDITSISKRLKELKSRKDSLEKELEELRATHSAISSLENVISALERRRNAISVEETEDEKVRLKQVQGTLSTSTVMENSIEKELERVESETSDLNEKYRMGPRSDVQGKIDVTVKRLAEHSELWSLLSLTDVESISKGRDEKKNLLNRIRELEEEKILIQESLRVSEVKKIASTIFTCPSCDEHLYMTEGKLHVCTEEMERSDSSDTYTQEDYDALMANINDCNARVQAIDKLISLSEKYRKPIAKNPREVQTKLDDLKRLLTLRKRRQELQDIPTSLEIISREEHEELRKEEVRLTTFIQRQIENQQRRDEFTRDIETKRSELAEMQRDANATPTDKTQELNNVIRERKELEELEKLVSLVENQINRQKDLDLMEERLNKAKERQALFTYMYEMAKHAESLYIQSVIDTFNVYLEEVLNELFDEPISVTLKGCKTLKSKPGETRPEIDIEIVYRGERYDSIEQLSGGEKSRISIGITLAFSNLTRKDLILLDEAVSPLDHNLRSRIVHVLNTSNKTALVISHEEIEGFFSSVLRL